MSNGASIGNGESLLRRAVRGAWRLLPHVAFLLLVTSWLAIHVEVIYSAIGGTASTVGLIGFLWKYAGAPTVEESEAAIGPFLVRPGFRSGLGALTLLLGALSLSYGSVTIELSAPEDGPVEISALRDGTPDTVGLRLGPDRPKRTWFARASYSGLPYTFRRGGHWGRHSLRAWRPRTLRYPDDFDGPIRVFGLLAPDLIGSPLRPQNIIRITRGENGPKLGEDSVPSIVARAFVLSFSESPPADAADSARWVALFQSVAGASTLNEAAANMWLHEGVTWIRSARELAVGDSVSIVVSQPPRGALVVRHLKLSERRTDVLLTINP